MDEIFVTETLKDRALHNGDSSLRHVLLDWDPDGVETGDFLGVEKWGGG